MAISMGAALLGSAVLGAGASIIGGSKQSKAATQAQTLVNNDNAQNRAFQERIYNNNAGLISPWQQSGVQANNAIMALLGYPQQAPQPSAFAGWNGSIGSPVPGAGGAFPAFYGPYRTPGINPGVPDGWGPESFNGAYELPQPAPGGVTTSVPNAQSAFDTYRGSTGYNFRVNEGVGALQSAFGRNLDSGAYKKAALRFGQGIASDEFARYMGYLTGQSQLGLSGASALAGVGQNFANNVVAGNQSAASAAANARLYAGNANANMWQNLGSSFGMGLGALAKGF